jgi:hypothetical protein
VGESEPAPRRTIFASRRKNRPLGGYLPFEKSRSYIGVFAFVGLLGIGSMAAYWYFSQVRALDQATEQAGTARGNPWLSYDEERRKEFQEKQKRALKALKARDKAKKTDVKPRTQDKLPADLKP